MSNTTTPKPGRLDEWAKLDLAPMVLRGKADLPEASLNERKTRVNGGRNSREPC